MKEDVKNYPSVRRATEVEKRRETDIVKKQETTLSVKGEDDERKAFERMVDEACRILNNFKMPRQRQISDAVIGIVIVAFFVIGGILFVNSMPEPEKQPLPAPSEAKQHFAQSGKTQPVQEEMAAGYAQILAERNLAKAEKARRIQDDIKAGYPYELAVFKQNRLAQAVSKVKVAERQYEAAMQKYSAKFTDKKDSLQYYQNRFAEVEMQINALAAPSNSDVALRQQRSELRNEAGFLSHKISYFTNLLDQQNKALGKVKKLKTQWLDEKKELSELQSLTQSEWSDKKYSMRMDYFVIAHIIAFGVIFVIFDKAKERKSTR